MIRYLNPFRLIGYFAGWAVSSYVRGYERGADRRTIAVDLVPAAFLLLVALVAVLMVRSW